MVSVLKRAGAAASTVLVGAGAAVLCAGALGLASLASAQAPASALATTPVDDIFADPALKAQAMELGAKVYAAQCAACHGADLKGRAEAHAPDLTDALWLFAGDDEESGGLVMFASDVEKTVRYGIRSEHEQARNLSVMPGLGPNGLDVLNDAELDAVTEYVLQLSGQSFDAGLAETGKALFEDKGNCWDCHSPDGIGNAAIGATDLTANVWLYGGDRASLRKSIAEGVAGVCPAFEGKLGEAEIRTVSVYVFDHAPPSEFE